MDQFLRQAMDLIRVTPYRNKGMFYSEMLLFLGSCAEEEVDLIIESGSLYGFSTDFLAKAWPGVMISIDKKLMFRYDHPFLLRLEGDSFDWMPVILNAHSHTPIGVIIDGPKGEWAIKLKNICMQHPNVRVVAIHDLPVGSGEDLHSHNDFWQQIRKEQGLDDSIKTGYEEKYPKGPGLAVWLNGTPYPG